MEIDFIWELSTIFESLEQWREWREPGKGNKRQFSSLQITRIDYFVI